MTGHGLGSYGNNPGYWQLEHDGGNTASPNDRVVVKLYDNSEGGYPFKGFILKTSAGTLTAKSSHAAAVSACAGAIGHTESSGKTVAEAYLDLPSSEGTVTVTAELVYSKTWVAALTLDIEVVEAWTQVGNDIVGSGAFKLGYSVSMNTDGTKLAVGVPYKSCADDVCTGAAKNGDTLAGYVHVFQYNETASPAWQTMGTGIPGLSGSPYSEQRGHMVSISGDGTRVASIGYYASGTAPVSRLKVHEWNSESQSWTDMPGLYIGHEPPFFAATISRDGTRVSALLYGYSAGYELLVFEVDSGGTWSRVGNKVNFACACASSESLASSNRGVVAMSADGNRVVVGFPAGDSDDYGMMQVYELASGGSTWGQMGGDIVGGFTASQSIGYAGEFGRSVAISADGSRVVAGAAGYNDGTYADLYGTEPYVRVYEWSSGSWQQLGSDVTMGQTAGGYDYHFGYSVDMSDDGSLIAVRAPRQNYKSLTLLYTFDSATNEWLKTAEIEDEAAYEWFPSGGTGDRGSITPISLSGDGKYVAIGADTHLVGYGLVRVFKDPSLAQDSPAPAAPAPPSSNSSSSSCSSSRATGGNVTTFGDYVIHSFTSSGTFEVTDSTLTEVDVLVVGGGASGAGGDNNNWGGVAVEEGRSFPSAGLLSRRGVTASESATVETAKLSSLLTLQQQTAAIASLTVTLRLVVALLRRTNAEETVALKSLVEMVMIRQVAAAAVQGPTALT